MISVAIQGGAMRSIYCLGAVRALTERAAARDVSGIYAASAGCVSGAVLASHLTGDLTQGIEVATDQLLDRLAGKRFIDQRRLAGIVDVDYLVGVIREITNLSATQLASHQVQFEVAVTEALTARAHYFDLGTSVSEEALRRALVATMAIPVLYRAPALVDGMRYVDGGISDPLPVFRALQQSAAHTVVAISSVAHGELAEEAKGKEKIILRVAPGISPRVRNLMLTRNPLADAAESLLASKSLNGVQLIHVSPSRPELLSSRTEVDPAKLRKLEALGYKDAQAAFEMAQLL